MRVVKLAQPGYDVKTTGDENQIYNSNWPLLKIYKQGSFKLTDFNQSQVITSHDLGYTPFFWWFTNENIEGWNGISSHIDYRSEFHGYLGGGGNGVRIDANKLFFYPTGASFSGSLIIYYYIFTLPLTEDYQAPQIKTGGISVGSNNRHAFKVAKPDKDISSHNLEDFVIHSDTRSPLIHSVNVKKLGTEESNSFGIPYVTVTHNLGYKPMFFGFRLQSDGSYEMLYGSSIIPGIVGFSSDERIVRYIDPSLGATLAIVVLKDPFIVDYSVRVNI